MTWSVLHVVAHPVPGLSGHRFWQVYAQGIGIRLESRHGCLSTVMRPELEIWPLEVLMQISREGCLS